MPVVPQVVAGVRAPTPVPAPTGGTGVSGMFSILGPLLAVGGFGLSLAAIAQSGVRGVPAQAAGARAGFSAIVSFFPGLNLVFGLTQLASALGFGGTVGEFRRTQNIESPSPPTGLQAPGAGAQLDALIAADPDFQRRLRESGERLREQRLSRLISFDPRTGAGQSARTRAIEEDPDRQLRVLRAQAKQRVRFVGVPSIFTRRTN